MSMMVHFSLQLSAVKAAQPGGTLQQISDSSLVVGQDGVHLCHEST